MDLNETILYYLKRAEEPLSSRDYQMAMWLKELKTYREIAKDNKLLYDYMYSRDE